MVYVSMFDYQGEFMVVSKYVSGLMHQLITAGFTVVTLTVDPRGCT